MKRIIIIQQTRINLYIKRCPRCQETLAIMMGSSSRVCMDCIKQKPYPERHIPLQIIQYDNKTLYVKIKKGEFETESVMGKKKHTIPSWNMI